MVDIAIDPNASNAGKGSGAALNYLTSGLPVIAVDTQNNRGFLLEKTRLAASSEEMKKK